MKKKHFFKNEPQAKRTVTGVLHVNRRGFGFVTIDEKDTGKDIFILPSKLNNAMSGDTVEVLVLNEAPKNIEKKELPTRGHRPRKGKYLEKYTNNKGKGADGEVIQILKQGFEEVTGKLSKEGNNYILIPIRKELPNHIFLSEKQDIDPKKLVNHWVKCKLIRQSEECKRLTCKILEDVSEEDSILGDLHAIITEFNLMPPYTEEVMEASKKIEPFNVADRENCLHLNPVTIDPKDAKDFDDAISISDGEIDGCITVGVHIADVAAYIQPGSFLDEEASERCFTAYLPGLTLPMLPHPLAANQCSLIANEERLAHSVFLQVESNTGKIKSSRRARTLIKVWHRLCHEETDFFLETGTIPTSWPDGLSKTIAQLHHLGKLMRKERQRMENFLELEIPETRIITKGMPPEIVGLKIARASAGSELVEEYMLAANTAVAKELIQREIPGLFRIHEGPTEDGLELFRKNTKETYDVEVPQLNSRKDINNFMKSIRNSEMFELLCTSLLGNLSRARYEAKPSLHYGLGKYQYTHFTSPIRRYSDTLVHQQLLAIDNNLELRPYEDMERFANIISKTEKNNDTAYFAAIDRIKIRYLASLDNDPKSRVREAIISKIRNTGLLLFLPELAMYGSVPLHLLTDDYYEVKGNEIIGKRHKRRYRCGDVIQVSICEADFIRGEAQFSIEETKKRKKGKSK